jgi:hypothetical protein
MQSCADETANNLQASAQFTEYVGLLAAHASTTDDHMWVCFELSSSWL